MILGSFVNIKDRSYPNALFEVIGFDNIQGLEALRLIARTYKDEVLSKPIAILIKPQEDCIPVDDSTASAQYLIDLGTKFYQMLNADPYKELQEFTLESDYENFLVQHNSHKKSA